MDGQPRLDGKKNDKGKVRLGLVPSTLIWAVGFILTRGARTYGDHNWRKGLDYTRVYDALQRHLNDWWEGDPLDRDLEKCKLCKRKNTDDSIECPDHSWKSHLWHAGCELAFLM